jgi:hypothetical protein
MAASLIARGASSDHLQFHHRCKRTGPQFRHARPKLHHQSRTMRHPPFLPRRRARVSIQQPTASHAHARRRQARFASTPEGTEIHRAPRRMHTCSRTPRPRRPRSMGVLCLAFFFVLRRSEIVATTVTTYGWFALKASDIAVIGSDGTPTAEPRLVTAVCIRFRGSKPNQHGPLVTRMLTRSGHPLLCPVLGALLLLRSRGNLTAAFPAAVFLSSARCPSCVMAARVAREIQVPPGGKKNIRGSSALTHSEPAAQPTCTERAWTRLQSSATAGGLPTHSSCTLACATNPSPQSPREW